MLTSFSDFFSNPTRDNYMEGLLNDMPKLSITPKKQYTAKRKLCELVDSDDNETDLPHVPSPIYSNHEDDMPEPPKKKKNKKHKKSKMLNSDSSMQCYVIFLKKFCVSLFVLFCH